MIPTAILAGFALGLWIRWRAVPAVAVGWTIVILFIDPSSALAGGLLGAANGLIGVVLALGLRRLLAIAMGSTGARQGHHD